MPLGFDPVGGSALTEAQPHVPRASTLVDVAGVFATGGTGVLTTRSTVLYGPEGVVVSGLLGNVEVSARAQHTLSGVAAALAPFKPGSVSSSNGWMAVFADDFELAASIGATGAVVTALHVNLTLSGVVSTGAIGTATVPNTTSLFYVEVAGLQAFGLSGTPALKLGAGGTPAGVQATATLGTDIIVLTSSFGTNVSAVPPSQWSPTPLL